MPPPLSELLVEWERRQHEGLPTTAEHLCADWPEMLPELRRRIRRLDACNRLLGLAAAGSQPPEPVPDRIADIQITGVLGRGGMGIVYQGWDPGLKRAVAVKVLQSTANSRTFIRAGELAARFDREREVLGRLDHEHIVPVYQSGVCDGKPYIVMALLAGGTLADRAAELTRRGPRAVARLLEMVARGVHAAHELHVLHRDLKPANILVDSKGNPRVSDFGLAKFWSPAEPCDEDAVETIPEFRPADLTFPGVQPGTLAYMAPEQFDPTLGKIGPATDVWALGVILFELLAGRRPFVPSADTPFADRVCRDPTPPCRGQYGRIPGWMRGILRRCLAKTPGERYGSAAELAAALRGGLQRARRWAWFAGTAGVLCLAVAAGFTGGWRASADPPSPLLAPQDPRFEELPEVTSALARLENREEVALVENGRHGPFHRVFGPETVRVVESDSTSLVLQSQWTGPGAAEFLPRLPPGQYRVRLQIRHDLGGDHSRVGVYVGGRYWESDRGRHLGCLVLEYRDVGPQAAQQPRPGRQTNCVAELKSLLTGEVRTQPHHWEGLGNRACPYLAAVAAGDQPKPRTLEVHLSDDRISAKWDGKEVGDMPRAKATANLSTFLRGYPEKQPSGQTVDPFTGGVGLIVYNGTASVTDFRIAPLK